jgi:hypothetical protein
MRSNRLAALARSVCVAAMGIALLTTSVHAQGGRGGPGGPGGMGRMGGGGDLFGPPVSSRDLDAFAKVLVLTPQQLDTAKALLDGAAADFQPLAKAARDQMDAARQEARDSGDPGAVWQSIGAKMGELRLARTKIETGFMNDLKGILTEEQAQKWPAVERANRRNKTIGRGLMSGERLDLTKLVERADLSPEALAPLKNIMEQYEVELDRELIKRNEVYEKAFAQGGNLAAAFGPGGDPTKAQELFDKGREAAIRVRDVNRKYARQIEAMLPEDKRAAFNQEVKRESFPMIYRDSYATHILDTADKMTDLDAGQKSGLTGVREAFTRDLNSLNVKSEAAWVEMEDTTTVQNMFSRFNDPKIQELRDARRTLEDQAVQKVNDLLNEAQRAKLPDRESVRGAGDNNPNGPRRAAPDNGGANGRPQRRGRGDPQTPQGDAAPAQPAPRG